MAKTVGTLQAAVDVARNVDFSDRVVWSARRDRVDAHVRLPLHRDGASQLLHDRALSSCRHHRVGLAHVTGRFGRDVDDVAGGLEEMWIAAGREETSHPTFDAHHLAVLLHGDVRDVIGPRDTGIVAQDVEPTERLDAMRQPWPAPRPPARCHPRGSPSLRHSRRARPSRSPVRVEVVPEQPGAPSAARRNATARRCPKPRP